MRPLKEVFVSNRFRAPLDASIWKAAFQGLVDALPRRTSALITADDVARVLKRNYDEERWTFQALLRLVDGFFAVIRTADPGVKANPYWDGLSVRSVCVKAHSIDALRTACANETKNAPENEKKLFDFEALLDPKTLWPSLLQTAPVPQPTERVAFRELDMSDADEVHEILSNPETWTYLEGEVYSVNRTSAFLARCEQQLASPTPSSWTFSVLERGGYQLIGFVRLETIGAAQAELTLFFQPDLFEKDTPRIAEALKATVKFGFHSLNLRRIQARNTVTDRARLRLFTENGFAGEGILREAALVQGRPVAVSLSAILRTPNP
jgi:ribosomal-protein-alanine N-acetyltransferase